MATQKTPHSNATYKTLGNHSTSNLQQVHELQDKKEHNIRFDNYNFFLEGSDQLNGLWNAKHDKRWIYNHIWRAGCARWFEKTLMTFFEEKKMLNAL